ncbi:MAG: hypothetical protein L0H94_00075 [Nitrospira sp.]|nr:hypothetical protein [Nitrospira sp.]
MVMTQRMRNIQQCLAIFGLVLMAMSVSAPAWAGESSTDLAKKTQNPVADLISIPLQNNMNFGIGPNNRMQNVLNVQPVIPINLNSEWNLITRTIMPIIKQPTLATTNDDTWGLGDVNVSAFLSPTDPKPFIWGVGPSVQLPTGTDEATGTRKWAAGPSAVALKIHGPWVVGGLVQQVWSFAGNSDRRDLSQALIQPFANYNLPDGWYLTASPIITADWEAADGNKWTVPVGGGFGKVFFIGKLPFNANCGYYANVVRPDPGADGTFRLQIALLLPKSILGQ